MMKSLWVCQSAILSRTSELLSWTALHRLLNNFTARLGSGHADAPAAHCRRLEDKTHTLQCRAVIQSRQSGSTKADFLTISVRGTINSPAAGHNINMCVELIDQTSGGPARILCSNTEFRDSQAGTFHFDKYKGKTISAKTEMSDFVEIAAIDISSLQFERTGGRTVLIEIAVLSSESRLLLASGSTRMLFENTQPGYMDIAEQANAARQLGVSLALHVASNNDGLSDENLCKIRDWFIAAWQKFPIGTEDQIDVALDRAVNFFKNGGQIDPERICLKISSIADQLTKLEIMDVCFSLIAKRTEAAIAYLNRLAHALQADHNQYLAMLEKKLTAEELQLFEPATFLGLTDQMSKEQICRILTSQYSRWNSRVTSTDSRVRQRAVYMIEAITRLRDSYT